MQRTESALSVRAAAGWNGHKAKAGLIANGSIQGLAKTACQNTRQTPLTEVFERKQALRQLVPIGSRSNDAEPRPAVDCHKRRRLQLCPEGLSTQLADTFGTTSAKDGVFHAATDAFDGNHNCPEVFQRAVQGRNQPSTPAGVPSAARCPARVGRQQIRVPAGTCFSAEQPTAGWKDH